MKTDMEEIEIIKVTSPSLFYAKSVCTNQTVERQEYNLLIERINQHYSNETLGLCSVLPKDEEYCIGRRTSDKKWYRVRVEAVFSRSKGPEASCFLVDEGITEYIPLRWLRQAQKQHMSVPFQVKEYCLYGVKPLNLKISPEDLSVSAKPSDEWDSSAVSFMEKYIKESIEVHVDKVFVDQNEVIHVNLYLTSAKRTKVCLNEVFVQQQYAIFYDPDEETSVDDISQEKLAKLKVFTTNKPQLCSSDSEEVQVRPGRRSLDSSLSTLLHTRTVASEKRPQGLQGEKSTSDSEYQRKPFTMEQLRKRQERNVVSSDNEFVARKLPMTSPPSSLLQAQIRPRMTLPPKSASLSSLQSSFARYPVPALSLPGSPCGNISDSSSSSQSGVRVPRLSPGGSPSMLEKLKSAIKSSPVSTSDNESVKSDSCVIRKKSPMLHKTIHEQTYVDSEPIVQDLFRIKEREHKKEIEKLDPGMQSDASVGSLVTMQSLMSGDQSIPIARARIPRTAKKSPKKVLYESDCDVPRQIPPAFERKSGNAAASAEKSKDEVKKSIPKISTNPDRVLARYKDSDAQADILAKKHKLMGQLTGKRLLDQLQIAGKSKQSAADSKSQLSLGGGKMNADGVLVHSKFPVKPVTSVSDAPLHPIIKKAFDVMDYPCPTVVQSYSWPGILRGRHVIGLAPPNTGKGFAYLAPLLTELLDSNNYSEIPAGNGPLAIILVPFWKKAQNMYDSIRKLLQQNSRPRVLVSYGGGGEDSQVIPLINGCEILVTTPRSLLRMMTKKATHLKRLCHLVIDDAEILLEVFMDEIQYLMTEYSGIVQEYSSRSAPHQIMLFGRQWCPIIDSFISAFLPDCILTITSGFEAAIYGRVQQIPYLWKSSQMVTQFLELMVTLATEKAKVIVFCTTVNSTVEVMQLLSSRSLYALHAHHDMDLLAIEQVAVDWCMSTGKLMVCTDECVAELKISDATAVIHYDLPLSKTRFGNRLQCMSKYYWNSTDREQKQEIQPVSHIIVTEESGQLLLSVMQLLKRSKSKIHRELKSMNHHVMQQKENDDGKDLCTYMKAYGTCKYQTKCKMRHTILPQIDNVTSDPCLASGEVKVLITHIEDASHFYVRILEHRSPDGTVKDFSATKSTLHFKMIDWFTVLSNRKKFSTIPGDICAMSEDDETFHRVKICDITGINSPGSDMKAEVLFVDDGRKGEVKLSKLYALPSHLKDIPFQAVEVFLCRVRPMDEDEDWTVRAGYFIYELLYRKEMDGRIVLRIGNTLWLDPLVERLHLKDTKTFSNHLYARSELLKNGFAVDNPSHLQHLYEACKDKIEIPELNRLSYSSEKNIEVEILPETNDFHDVYLPAVDLPSLLFLQRAENIKRLEKMNDEISERMKIPENVNSKTSSLKPGDVCLANFKEDDRWYRVKIMAEMEDGGMEILYGDFGDKETTTRDKLARLPEEFKELPFQAIECELAHVNPRGENWEEESGDIIWDLSHYVTSEKKRLVAKVVSKSTPEFTGSHKYCVELYETSTADDINIARELVWSGLASPHDSSSLYDLFDLPQPSQFYRVPIMKIQDLCCLIYWERNGDRAQMASKEILQLMTTCAKSVPLNLLGHNALAAVIKMIGRNGDKHIHQRLTDSLVISAEASSRLCEEIFEKDGCVGIIRCLEQNNRSWIQEQALEAICRLLNCSPMFLQVFEDNYVVQILCELLEASEEVKVKLGTCDVVYSLLEKSARTREIIHEFGVCTGIVVCLEENHDQGLEEAVMVLLDKLVEIDGSQIALTKEKLARTVVGFLNKKQSDKCVMCGVRFCINFAETSRKHKTSLLQLETVLTVNRIIESSEVSLTTKELCNRLKSCLVVKVPHQQSLINQPLSSLHAASQERSLMPLVSWAQDCFTATLAIKVKGVTARSQPVKFTENAVLFSATVEGKLYKVNWDLYAEILPAKSRVSIKASEVLISIRKKEKSRWPRLLRSKTKPTNLSIDFERFLDSSDDDKELNEEAPFAVKKKKSKWLHGEKPRVKKGGLGGQDSKDSSDTGSDSLSDIDNVGEHDPYNILGVRG